MGWNGWRPIATVNGWRQQLDESYKKRAGTRPRFARLAHRAFARWRESSLRGFRPSRAWWLEALRLQVNWPGALVAEHFGQSARKRLRLGFARRPKKSATDLRWDWIGAFHLLHRRRFVAATWIEEPAARGRARYNNSPAAERFDTRHTRARNMDSWRRNANSTVDARSGALERCSPFRHATSVAIHHAIYSLRHRQRHVHSAESAIRCANQLLL